MVSSEQKQSSKKSETRCILTEITAYMDTTRSSILTVGIGPCNPQHTKHYEGTKHHFEVLVFMFSFVFCPANACLVLLINFPKTSFHHLATPNEKYDLCLCLVFRWRYYTACSAQDHRNQSWMLRSRFIHGLISRRLFIVKATLSALGVRL